MTLQIQRRTFTVDEYHVMLRANILTEDDRVELLDGEIVNMAPIGSEHSGCVLRLNHLLLQRLLGRALVNIQNPIILSDHSEPQPDLALLVPRADFYTGSHPGSLDIYLLIEVTDTTADFDRQVKVPLYARAGIREVWLVDLAAQGIEVYRDPAEGSYRTNTRLKDAQCLSPLAFPDLVLTAKDILG